MPKGLARANYRPISVLPVISRLFEKLVTDQLYKHHRGISLNILSHYLVFRDISILNIFTYFSILFSFLFLDLGKLVGLVFIDLKKAFDSVDHKILCKKLELYGVQNRELSWFESYLTSRKQFCRVNGVDSEIGDIDVGVPQGSCLGPLLSSSTSTTSHKLSKTPLCLCMLMIPVCVISPQI